MSVAVDPRFVRIAGSKENIMPDSYDREVVRQETTGGEPVRPVAPVTPVTTSSTSRTAVYREGGYNSRAIQAVWWIVGFIDVLIAIRFVLKLFGANPAPFVRFMYDLTWPLVAPFHGIFNTAQEGRSILEPESLVAMAIYALIGWHRLAHPAHVPSSFDHDRRRLTTAIARLEPPCGAAFRWPAQHDVARRTREGYGPEG